MAINYIEQQYNKFNTTIQTIEQNWRNEQITNKTALDLLRQQRKEMLHFLNNHELTSRGLDFIDLSRKLLRLIKTVEDEMKTIYVLQTDKTKMIATSDESLMKKCVARLSKDTAYMTHKRQICHTEQDLDKMFFSSELSSID